MASFQDSVTEELGLFVEKARRVIQKQVLHYHCNTVLVAVDYGSICSIFIKGECEPKYKFPPLKRYERKTVHEVAAHYGCTSESHGTEDRRYTIVRILRLALSESPCAVPVRL